MRGTVPLLVTLGGFLFFGEILGPWQTLGVVLIAAGIMSLSLGKTRAATSSILFALTTGLIIACYSTVDSRGVKMVEQPAAYALWVLFLFGLMITIAFVLPAGALSSI